MVFRFGKIVVEIGMNRFCSEGNNSLKDLVVGRMINK